MHPFKQLPRQGQSTRPDDFDPHRVSRGDLARQMAGDDARCDRTSVMSAMLAREISCCAP